MTARSGVVIGIGAALVAAAVLLGAVVGVRSFDRLTGGRAAARCDFGGYSLRTDQAQVAATIEGESMRLGVPEPADVLVLMAALQESSLTNLAPGQGDRDSVGVLQQRPSQGWGTAEQLGEIDFATQQFLDALLKVPGWQTMAPADAIQAVQISADGSAYAKHEGLARALADALSGRAPAGIRCRFDHPTTTASTDQIAAGLEDELAGPVPVVADGRVTVPGAHWQTAAWLVVNADALGITRVQYDGRSWRPGQPWAADPSASAGAVVATVTPDG